MTTMRQKVSIGLIFSGIALGSAAVIAALPSPQGGDHMVYHDDTGVKHPEGDLRGAINRKTAIWMVVGAVAMVVLGASIREP